MKYILSFSKKSQVLFYLKIFVVVIFFFSSTANAAYFSFQPHTIQQPDGEEIHCFVSGDEYFNWLHDAEGYTIIQAADGYFYYGLEEDGIVVPSIYKVNSINPVQAGLNKWAKISPENYAKRKQAMYYPIDKSIKGPSLGNMVNLVVYIRFNGDSEFTTTRSVYDARFNNPNAISLNHYFEEVSYGNLDITSYHYPICDLTTNLSYEDIHPRAYYLPYNATTNPTGYQDSDDRRIREHTLLVNAINHIAPQVPTSLNLDLDNDGNVDNVTFIIRGNSGAWADLLWAHRWRLYSQTVNINGKRVWDYTFQPENQADIYTLCHEMFHVVGAPDLYRYSQDGFVPVGTWDLMASGFVHMGAYMKWKYASQNWITHIPEITTPGTYTLNPITSPANNAYKLAVPGNSNEFFVFEYRQKTGDYESNVPGTGLLIYRINTAAGNGNASGPPDEVYLYRPNGTLTQNGQLNNAAFSANTGRTQFNDHTNPPCFLSNNQLAGIEIYDVTTADSTISFTYGIDYRPTAFFEALPPVSCTGIIEFNDLSSKTPTSWFWDFGDGYTSTLQNPSHTYYTNGYKSIKLVVSNTHGSDSIVRTNYVRVDKPLAPSTNGGESCTPQAFTLYAQNNYGGELHWYDEAQGGNLVHTGDSLQTNVITETVSYYVEEIVPAQIQNIGPADNTIGSGVYFNHPNTHYLVFDCHKTIIIKSVLVFAETAKDRRIVIRDKTDNIIRDTTVYLTTGAHRINLNFELPPDVNYKMECMTPNAMLYRNSNGTNFPYSLSGLVSIHGNSASNLSYYYYFYDWEVKGEECISRRREVSGHIQTPMADFTNSNAGLTANFTNTSTYTNNYVWDFGDGNTSTATNPQHTFADEGYYNVMLIAEGPCGSDTITKQVPVFFASVGNVHFNDLVDVYPNPFTDELIVSIQEDRKVYISIVNSIGQEVFRNTLASKGQHVLNVSDLPSGLYIVLLSDGHNHSSGRKLIKY